MNIKNKILLTLIAIIFVICSFNTNCFAFEQSFTLYKGKYCTVDLPDWILEEGYNYIFYTSYCKHYNGNDMYYYGLIVSKGKIYLEQSFDSDGYENVYLHSDGENKLIRLISASEMSGTNISDDTILKNINGYLDSYDKEKCFSYAEHKKEVGTNYNYPAYSIVSNAVVSCNEDIYKYNSDDIIFSHGERGTDQGDISDNTTGDNDTDSGNTTDSDDSGGILSSIKEGFENVVNFFKKLIEGITNIFKTIGDNFLDLFTKLGEWFSDLFEKLGNWFSSLGSSIGGFFNSLWENIKSFFTGVVEFFANFWELIEDFFIRIFRFLFVPEQNSFTGIIDIVKSKFDFIETIKISANSLKDLISNVGTAPKLTININDNEFGIKKLTIIDLEWYKPYKTYGDLILTGFIYAFFLWRLFITIPNIIKGQAGTVSDVIKITDNGGKI